MVSKLCHIIELLAAVMALGLFLHVLLDEVFAESGFVTEADIANFTVKSFELLLLLLDKRLLLVLSFLFLYWRSTAVEEMFLYECFDDFFLTHRTVYLHEYCIIFWIKLVFSFFFLFRYYNILLLQVDYSL